MKKSLKDDWMMDEASFGPTLNNMETLILGEPKEFIRFLDEMDESMTLDHQNIVLKHFAIRMKSRLDSFQAITVVEEEPEEVDVYLVDSPEHTPQSAMDAEAAVRKQLVDNLWNKR